jgi:Putative addiction module component
MSTAFADIEKLAIGLSVKQRAKLASSLLRSLPSPGWDDDDDGVEEAMRRSRELEEHPEIAITLEELDRRMKERFG